MLNPLDQTTLQFIYSLVIGNNLKEDLECYLNFVGNDDPNIKHFIMEFVGKCKDYNIKQVLLNEEFTKPENMNLSMTTTRTAVIEIIVEENPVSIL